MSEDIQHVEMVIIEGEEIAARLEVKTVSANEFEVG